jgi:hypothetical protein
LDCLHYFPHLTYSQCWMAELSANFWPQGFVRVSFKQSEISRFFLSLNLVWMSKSVLLSVCLLQNYCKLQKRVHSSRSRKLSSLSVACPWPVVLSGYSGVFHH